MSLIAEGQRIMCDEEGCNSIAAVPVALHPSLKLAEQLSPPADGWLYILNKKPFMHLCPNCARRYLARHHDDNPE